MRLDLAPYNGTTLDHGTYPDILESKCYEWVSSATGRFNERSDTTRRATPGSPVASFRLPARPSQPPRPGSEAHAQPRTPLLNAVQEDGIIASQ